MLPYTIMIINTIQTPNGQHIKWCNDLLITKRITLSMGGSLRLINGYYADGHINNQEEVKRLTENQEAFAHNMNAYL